MENSAPKEIAPLEKKFDWDAFGKEVLEAIGPADKRGVALFMNRYMGQKATVIDYWQNSLKYAEDSALFQQKKDASTRAANLMQGMMHGTEVFNPAFVPILNELDKVMDEQKGIPPQSDLDTFYNVLEVPPNDRAIIF